MLIITTLAAAVLTLLLVRLSFAVIRLRRSNQVAFGTGSHPELERAIRAQGNFAEYVPFGLILLGCLELNGAPKWLVAIPALTLIVGRLFHAKGINEPPPNFTNRVRGMQFTFGTLITLAVLNVGWLAYQMSFSDVH
jgi:hypothetical protein